MLWKDSSEYQLFLTCTICRKIRLRGPTCSSFIIFVRLFCVFTLFSLHIVAGRCSFIWLWLALLFCDGPLEAPPAISSQWYALCPRSGEQGVSWGLVAERRMTIRPLFNLFPSQYFMQIPPATTAIRCVGWCTLPCPEKYLGLAHLLIKLNTLELYAICTTVVQGGLAHAWTDTRFESFSSTRCKCGKFSFASFQTFTS